MSQIMDEIRLCYGTFEADLCKNVMTGCNRVMYNTMANDLHFNDTSVFVFSLFLEGPLCRIYGDQLAVMEYNIPKYSQLQIVMFL